MCDAPYTPIDQQEITCKATFRRRCVLFIGAAIVFISACSHNPVDSGNRFPVNPGPILFISDNSGTDQLYSMNEDGSNVQQLTDDSHFPILDAKWSPDGSKIAVISLVGDSLTYPYYRRAIFIMNADGSHRYQLTPQWFDTVDSTGRKVEYGGASGPVWSPDSKQIAYTRLMVPEAADNNDIFIIDVNGTNEKRITRNTSISEGRVDWSQDGKSFLADVIDWTNTRSTVDIFSRNGKLQKQITPDSLTSYDALWSPDQKHIVYTSWGGVRQELFISDGDGNGAKVLPTTNRTFNNAVAWSGDSKKILFNATDSPGSSWGIFLINEDGSNLAEITPTNITNTLAVSWKRR